MDTRKRFWINNKKVTFKSYNGQEILDSQDLQRPEGEQHIEDSEEEGDTR